MPLKHYYNGAVVTSKIQLVSDVGIMSEANLGQAANIRVMVEDPQGWDDYQPYKSWAIQEDSIAAGSNTIWHGYVGRQVIRRAPEHGLITGAARLWELDLVEDNGVLTWRVFTGTDANRPSETVAARVSWLLSSSEYSSLIYDHGLVAAPATTVDAVDYRGRTAIDVLGDCAIQTGYNPFVRWNEFHGNRELIFHDQETSGLDASSLRVSNVLADIDQSTTWDPGLDARSESDPSRIASGIYVAYNNSAYYAQNASTGSNYTTIDQVAPTANIKTSTQAQALTSRLLVQHSEQDDKITGVRLIVPQEHINDVRHGQLISGKFSHFRTTYQSFHNFRVLTKTLGRAQGPAPSTWAMDLELSPASSAPGLDQYVTDSLVGDYVNATWPEGAPGTGKVGVSFVALRGDPAAQVPASYDGPGALANLVSGTSYTQLVTAANGSGIDGAALAWRMTTSSDTANIRWTGMGGSSRPRSHNVILSGVTSAGTAVEDYVLGSSSPSSITVHANGAGIIVFGMAYAYPGPTDHVGWLGVGHPEGFTVTASSGVLLGYAYAAGEFHPLSWLAYLSVTAAGDYSVGFSLSPATGYGDALNSYAIRRQGCWFG